MILKGLWKMNNFSKFVDYCKIGSNTNQLQQYLIIWDDRYPSVIRRCLAMDLQKRFIKERLHGAQAPTNELEGLKTLIEGLKLDLQPVIKFHSSVPKELEPVKKRLSKKKKDQLEIEQHLKELNSGIYKEWVKGANTP